MGGPARERRRERRKPPHINDKLGIGDEVRARLAFAVHSDYVQRIVEAVIDDVTEDVMLTSSYQTDGVWSAADERLALGRVLCRRLGIEV